MKHRRSRKHHANAGFTLVETTIATAVALFGMAAAMSLNQGHLRLVKSARQSNAATLCLQERVEQMRLADWRKLTDADYLKNTVLATRARSGAPLDQAWETITITAYPDPAAAQQLIVERRSGGERVTRVNGEGLSSQPLAEVEFQVGWLGPDQRPRVRASTTMISNGGISRMNLPGMGSAGGAPPTSSTPAPAASPSATPAPAATPSPTPTPAPGKSNGRGNVGGVSGKK
jgi:type II secretory pathway pseudopilin PulG